MLRSFAKNIKFQTQSHNPRLFLSLNSKFFLPFNDSIKDPNFQDKILKQRLNKKIDISLQKHQEKNPEEDLNSFETTPLFLDRNFQWLAANSGVLSATILFSAYNTSDYLISACLLTDWIGCVTAGYTGIYFAMACLNYNKKNLKNPSYDAKYKYSFCFPTILSINVSLFMMHHFNPYFFMPISFAILISFWKDYHMVSASALPRFFMSYKLKLILMSNLAWLIVVFALLQNIKFNRKMIAFKSELEHKIEENVEKFKKEDDEIEKKHNLIMKQLKNPKL